MLHPPNNNGFSAPVVFGGKWCGIPTPCAANGSVLCKHGNAAAGHHGSAFRVGLSAPIDRVAPLAKDAAIHCESRLAMNADRPTESIIIRWMEH